MNPVLGQFQKHTNEFLDALALFPERSRSLAPEGEWSAAYIVHHVADGETHFSGRYLLIVGADNPPLTLFDEERYPEALHYEKRTVAKSLAAIVGMRAMIFETLSLLGEEAWARTMVREDGSQVTLAELVAQADGHIAGHTEQLVRLSSVI